MNLDEEKKKMVEAGIASSIDELAWLTEAYIAEQERIAQPYPEKTDAAGNLLSALDYGNHFYTTNGGAKWHWTSGDNTPGGNLNCGTNRSWSYNRRPGDSYVVKGRCPGGFDWYEFNIYH
nr:hypothetical protein [uncultured Albidiferax sp.]